MAGGLFDSFFMAGFECASHRRKDGVRLDLIRATRHDRYARRDYAACAALGMRGVRDGLRWHLIEPVPGSYDWSSWLPMLAAADEAGVSVVWDLLHYGTPDHVDRSSGAFVDAFARFAAAAARVHREVTGRALAACPINEISFFSWAIEVGYFPSAGGLMTKPGWFKRQLVRTAIAGAEAIRAEDADARLLWAEPLIHVAPRDPGRAERKRAEAYRLAQFEAYDLLTGAAEPELGGHPGLVDVVGLNYYPHNQWMFNGPTVPMGHHAYRPLADMLVEAAARYAKPLFIAETGSEGSARPAWLHYACDEVRAAMARGVRVDGICLYPITAYPGWDNSRHCDAGLLSVADRDGTRQVDAPLLAEIERQLALFGLPR